MQLFLVLCHVGIYLALLSWLLPTLFLLRLMIPTLIIILSTRINYMKLLSLFLSDNLLINQGLATKIVKRDRVKEKRSAVLMIGQLSENEKSSSLTNVVWGIQNFSYSIQFMCICILKQDELTENPRCSKSKKMFLQWKNVILLVSSQSNLNLIWCLARCFELSRISLSMPCLIAKEIISLGDEGENTFCRLSGWVEEYRVESSTPSLFTKVSLKEGIFLFISFFSRIFIKSYLLKITWVSWSRSFCMFHIYKNLSDYCIIREAKDPDCDEVETETDLFLIPQDHHWSAQKQDARSFDQMNQFHLRRNLCI